jgi:hypothetical protein
VEAGGVMSVSWSVDPSLYLEQLTRRKADAIERDIVRLAQSLLNEAEQYMKQNHRWSNVTGETEQGLYSDIEHAVRERVTLLMSYGPTSEHAWTLEANVRFALLGDAADAIWPLLYRGAVEICRRHSG